MAVAALLLWLATAGAGTFLLVNAISRGNAASTKPAAGPHAKADQLPGLRDLAEFAHPALALAGLGCWLGYVVSGDWLFAAVGLGVLLGAICAGLSWFTVNRRARKRADGGGPAPLLPSPRLLLLHAAGAALTVLIVALVTARV